MHAAGLGFFLLVFSTDGAGGRSLGGVLAEILNSQCACTFAVEINTTALTFENFSLAQFAVGVGYARRLRLACVCVCVCVCVCEHHDQRPKSQCLVF